MNKISEIISYIPASENPLSADVGIIHGETCEWLFDVGSSDESAEIINNISRPKNVVLSHFHTDHSSNLSRISYSRLYCGNFSCKKFQSGISVNKPVIINDGVALTVFPIPCCHAKGSVGLLVNDYAFLGDAVYGTHKNGNAVYNSTQLKATIDTLKNLNSRYFLISHDKKFIHDKFEIIENLEKIYAMRTPDAPYIKITSAD